MNVVIQAVTRSALFRNFFLIPDNYKGKTHPVVVRTGELVRKLWTRNHFKAHISPHELLQAVVATSNKRFRITEQSDAVDFLTWYLNTLHMNLAKKRTSKSIVTAAFQGRMVVTQRRLTSKELVNNEVEHEKAQLAERNLESFETTTSEAPFLYLSLDVPPPPLYTDAEKENIIPQVPLFSLFDKFDGVTEHRKGNLAHTYKLIKLPRYLILYIKRFTKNNFFMEKNPTIVNFPIKNLELKDYVDVEAGTRTKYDLLANVVHTGKPGAGKGRYLVHILHKVLLPQPCGCMHSVSLKSCT